MLYELIYHSLADPDFGSEQVHVMLHKARLYNQTHNITGCLLYYQNEFIQIIEGEKMAILDLCKKIALDPRHSHVLILAQGDIEKRGFNQWSMAFQDLSLYQTKQNGSISIEELLSMFGNTSNPGKAKKLFEAIARDIKSGNLT